MIFLSTIVTSQNWDLQFEIPVNSNGKDGGIITDGNYLYIYNYNLNLHEVRNFDGSYANVFQISSVSSLNDLTFDGTYFYHIRDDKPEFYKMDFYSSPASLVE